MSKKCYVTSLFAIVFAILAIPGFSKPAGYSWGKGEIEITAESEISKLGENNSKTRILVGEATRKAGYAAIIRLISTLPLDSTRKVGDLEKSNQAFGKQLPEWVVMHGMLTHFQYTSESSGSVRISIPADEFAKFVSRYDIPPAVKREKKKEEVKKKEIEKKEETNGEKKKNSGPKNSIVLAGQMGIEKDGKLSVKERMSKTEATVRGVTKEGIWKELNETKVSGEMTFSQWTQAHPGEEKNLKDIVEKNLWMGEVSWNKEKSVVKVEAKLNLKPIYTAIQNVEKKIENEPKKTQSRDTTTPKPAKKNTK